MLRQYDQPSLHVLCVKDWKQACSIALSSKLNQVNNNVTVDLINQNGLSA